MFKLVQATIPKALAGGVVVGKIGSATATLNEIIEYESSLNKSSSDEHIKTWEQISSIISEVQHNSSLRLYFECS